MKRLANACRTGAMPMFITILSSSTQQRREMTKLSFERVFRTNLLFNSWQPWLFLYNPSIGWLKFYRFSMKLTRKGNSSEIISLTDIISSPWVKKRECERVINVERLLVFSDMVIPRRFLQKAAKECTNLTNAPARLACNACKRVGIYSALVY